MKWKSPILLGGVILWAASVQACLTFCLKHDTEIVFGRNFDWNVDTGAVIVNRRNVEKTAFALPPDRPVSWVSKYGSVTFNQSSREIPIGGMNEEGLVIESLVCRAEHAPADARKAISELQWIQYHLDTCKTVDEVIQSAGAVRIFRFAVSLHYFITDGSGQSAVIEFIGGKMVHRSAGSLPARVLANTIYDDALAAQAGDSRSRKDSRFARAARRLEDYDGRKPPTEYAFDTLDAVAQGDFTKWQVVYDIPHRRISFRTLRKHKIKTLDLTRLDFEHATESLMLDVNIGGEGSVQTQLKTCTEARNNELIDESLRQFKKAGILQHIRPEHVEVIRKVVAACKPRP